jgi:adenylate cyclase
LLNDYFECFAGAVMDAKGEVVKFIGDALLAIFTFDQEVPLEKACGRALNAVNVAFDRLAFLNTGRSVEGRTQISCGLALHVGDVMFGNIGAPGRLDYTVIGPAVNRASRIAGLCRDLAQPVLLSSQFVAAVPSVARALGEYPIRGSETAEKIFVPLGRSN